MIPTYTPDSQYLIHVSEEYARKALARGELRLSDEGHHVLIEQPINEMDEATKRRYRLAKERKAR